MADAETIAEPVSPELAPDAQRVSTLDRHAELTTKLTAAFDLAGTPGRGRYQIAKTMAEAVYALRIVSLSPRATRLTKRQCAEMVRALKAAQIAIAVEFVDRMHADDQLLNIRALGTLVLHWAAGARVRQTRPPHIRDAEEISAIFFHQLCAEALLERLSRRSTADAAARSATIRSLLDVDGSVGAKQ